MADKSVRKGFGSVERIESIRKMPCLVCGKTPSENAHVKSRGAGGTKEDIVPLCSEHHDDLHHMGIQTFQSKYDINLFKMAEEIAEHFGDL